MLFSTTDFRQIRPKALGAVSIGALLSIGLDVALTAHDAASAASAYAVTIARGANIAVEFHAPANARCELGAMNSPSSHRLTAISDENGTVRYFASTASMTRTAVLATLECTSSKAHTLIGLTLTPGGTAPQRASIAPSRPVTLANLTTTARFGVLPGTPAGFDVTTASAAQLAQLHYPPRPDSRQNALGYAMWRKAMTTPGMYTPTVPVPIPSYQNPVSNAIVSAPLASGRLKPQTPESFQSLSPTQCGSLILEFDGLLEGLDGNWNIPAVFGLDGLLSTSSTTIALNAVSEGTEQDAYDIPGFGYFSSYYAWYQAGSNRYGFNFAIGPGENVAGDLGVGYGEAWGFQIYDAGAGRYAQATVALPVNYESYFAEWVEQRPISTLPLALFSPVTIGSTQADGPGMWAADGSAYPYRVGLPPTPSDGFQYSLQMTSTGMSVGDRMCSSSIIPSTIYGIGEGDAAVRLQFVSPL